MPSLETRSSPEVVQPVLSVADLKVSFQMPNGWKPVVHGISFDIKPRETVAIVGESGSGKSVTSLAIMRLLPAEQSRIEGRIHLHGKELLSLQPSEMREIRGRDIGMIFQEPMTSLNPSMKIGIQISEALISHRGMDWDEAAKESVRLMERVRIPVASRRFHDYPHRLSGGMRQRIMIAMALACSPRLLIADEPTTALDVTIQAEILSLMRELQEEEDMSVLFITHDMGVVAETADRTLVMYHGNMVEQGSTERLFSKAEHPYSRALISAVPQLGSMKDITNPVRYPVIDVKTGEETIGARAMQSSPKSEQVPLLQVQDLQVRFNIHSGLLGRVSGRVHAVENVSFDLQERETLAIVGESGSGKSTIGRAITRLVNTVGGDVRLRGKSVLDLKGETARQMRQQVQMIFQDPYASLDPRKSVRKAIAEPILAHSLARASEIDGIVSDLLMKVGLPPEVMHRRPHEFSGGQRQRICIARALALKPAILVADEAVSALDVSIKAQVINLMMDLQQELGLSYLFISHDMAAVERISHRVAVMYLGEIVEIGPRQQVLNNPCHPYTQKLIAAVPVPDPALRNRDKPKDSAGEIRNAVRPVDFVVPERRYREISAGHLVMDA
ncbi:dipeptide ABC transporter ATP-binding protein [Agrobacterium vitis]|nr:ABC transporter ATP-binding protein [Allorhizobium ampelinum]MUO31359.1 dipeptide ABC transporter ATP-binding protein [Agrobacterium vitis]MCF1450250.1 ABC transporter ATP-binding protein [Allorhizobium ampelinum]MCF1495921.1 ABC transporter ATP-binding protein [Allorhizobium ampelinum]MUO45187.1 dipeptide ABC transporter ATP-binding protein [Agrobacterium vitis]